MNLEPHTHEVKISGGIARGYAYGVVYGDTGVMVNRYLPFLERRLRRAVRVAIKRHDEGMARHHQDLRLKSQVKQALVPTPTDSEIVAHAEQAKMDQYPGQHRVVSGGCHICDHLATHQPEPA